MEKFNLYFFIQDEYRGSSYGIGTYINQIINTTSSSNSINLTLIHIHSQEKELKIEEFGNIKQIFIPTFKKPQKIRIDDFENRYIRNTVYLLKEIIPDNSCNIFHFQYLDQCQSISLIKKMFSGKIVLTVHYTNWSFKLLGDRNHLNNILSKPEDQLTPFDKMVLQFVERDKKTVSLCDQVICIAQHSYEYILKITKMGEKKICIIPNGIKDAYRSISEKRRNYLRAKFGITSCQKIILFVGRLDEVKGIAYLIQSFKKLLITHPKSLLVIVGDGGSFNYWFSLINNYWTKIIFTGKLNKRQLYNWYKIANIGVSCPIHEEFGMVAIEMMMHRLPIIVTNTGGLAEIIDDRINGLKVPIKKIKNKPGVNVDILVKQMQFLLDNPGFASQIGVNARKKFLEKYQLTCFKKNMLNFYTNISH
jgi:glycosyltransferase